MTFQKRASYRLHFVRSSFADHIFEQADICSMQCLVPLVLRVFLLSVLGKSCRHLLTYGGRVLISRRRLFVHSVGALRCADRGDEHGLKLTRARLAKTIMITVDVWLWLYQRKYECIEFICFRREEEMSCWNYRWWHETYFFLHNLSVNLDTWCSDTWIYTFWNQTPQAGHFTLE